MRPIAQQIITDVNEGKCIKEIDLRCVVESRVTTAGMLMHKNLLGKDNRAREHGPHRSQEQVEILKELATLIAVKKTDIHESQEKIRAHRVSSKATRLFLTK